MKAHNTRHRLPRSGSGASAAPPGPVSDIYSAPIVGGIAGGERNINTITNIVNPAREVNMFDLLKPYITLDALYDSRKREEEHASTCQPDTRTRIIQDIRNWFDSNSHPVCWLRGPAGTGKSTIAQTIAEDYNENGRLAATFFFSRKKGDREDVNKLIPTLAYQIARNIPSTRSPIQSTLNDRVQPIFSQRLRDQFSRLVVEPVAAIEERNQSLIIVDGLDECSSQDGVLEFIRLLGENMTTLGLHFQFLLTSRPERDLDTIFRSDVIRNTAFWLALEDSKDDVRKYLKESLRKLRWKYDSIMRGEPVKWPPGLILEDLVKRSEGLFIYARTAVGYIGDGNGAPQDKLQKVLNAHDGVDPLYTQVITDAQQSENFDCVMGALMYLRYPLTVDQLAELLELDVYKILVAIDRCRSILVIPDNSSKSIRPYHASLRDFLTSQERSSDLFCSPAKYHAILITQCLKAITKAFMNGDSPPEYACISWYYHGALLLSVENISKELRLYQGIEAQIKQVNLKWLQYWMKKALARATLLYIKVDFPSSKNIPEQHRALRLKLKRIAMILDNVS